jgi:archaellum component FlaF (FlaF/FlaG flagellin family)
MAVKSLKRSTVVSLAQTDNSAAVGYSFQDFHHLETIVLGATTASVSFINLDKYAAEYKHLQLRWTARSTQAQEYAGMAMTFNGDTGANYSNHWIKGDGSSVSSGAPTYVLGIGSQANQFELPGASQGANIFGCGVYDLLDIFSTSKYKTVKHFGGRGPVSTADKQIALTSGNWRSASSVSSITLTPNGSFVLGSRFSLYGIK